MLNFKLKNKIDKSGFYIPSDVGYFNLWTKIFVLSAEKFAPWANIHCHIFDGSFKEIEWCEKHNVSVSTETTPYNFQTIDEKKGFWVNARFLRIIEIYNDNVPFIALDSDCVIVNQITQNEFMRDLEHDWVAVREKGDGCLGGCLGFSSDGIGRYEIYNELSRTVKNQGWKWFNDQDTFNKLLKESKLNSFSMKYIDYHYRDESKIWAGKGSKRFKKKGKNNFPTAVESYQKILEREIL
jgi:hypothetical protein